MPAATSCSLVAAIELADIGDPIGLGDEPARQRIAVDAQSDVVVHAGILVATGRDAGGYSAAARRCRFCWAAATLARATSSPRAC